MRKKNEKLEIGTQKRQCRLQERRLQ